MKMIKKLTCGAVMLGLLSALTGCGNGGGSSNAVAKADENGNYLTNGSFEEADFAGWTITNNDDVTEELDVYDRETDAYEGAQSLHFYSGSNIVSFTAEQTVANLPAGTYKFTGHIQGDGAGDSPSIFFYVNVNGETYTEETSLKGYVNWNTSEISGLSVAEGDSVTVGVSVSVAQGGWGTVDGLTLEKE